MAKQAGMKNQGAWFRMNKYIRSLSTSELANLVGSIGNCANIDAAYNALTNIKASVGIDLAIPMTADLWAAALGAHGIPLQIWMGRLTFTLYQKNGDGSYSALYQRPIADFAKELRKVCTRFKRTHRQLKDVFNIGDLHQNNPGGFPDANKAQ